MEVERQEPLQKGRACSDLQTLSAPGMRYLLEPAEEIALAFPQAPWAELEVLAGIALEFQEDSQLAN
jgi:hypothetical protein